MKTKVNMVCLFAIVFAGVMSASTVYTISVPNSGGVGFTGPYATATVNLIDPTDATVTIDSISPYVLGDGGTFGMNVSGSFTAGTPTETNSLAGFKPTFDHYDLSDGNVSSFGSLDLIGVNFDGYTHAATHIVVPLTATGGNSWATSAAVLVANTPGFAVEDHIFVSGSNCGGSPCTFFAGNGAGDAPQSTPELDSALLIGLGLIGLGLKRLKLQKL